MRQLSDILEEKIKEVGGKASLGRMLGGIPGQTIFQYTKGVVPSIQFALKWKEVFNENLIELMSDDRPPIVAEPQPDYKQLEKRIVDLEKKLKERP